MRKFSRDKSENSNFIFTIIESAKNFNQLIKELRMKIKRWPKNRIALIAIGSIIATGCGKEHSNRPVKLDGLKSTQTSSEPAFEASTESKTDSLGSDESKLSHVEEVRTTTSEEESSEVNSDSAVTEHLNTSLSLEVQDPLHPCNLGRVIVKSKATIAASAKCLQFFVDNIEVLSGAELTIEEGVQIELLGGEPNLEHVKVSPGGKLSLKGSLSQPIKLFRSLEREPALYSVHGDFESVHATLENAELTLFADSPKSLNSIKIINRGNSQEHKSALICYECSINKFENVEIVTGKDGVGFTTSLSGLINISANSLKMTSESIQKIHIYNGTGSAAMSVPAAILPNLGYTYKVMSQALNITGNSYKIEPGVKLEMCNGCQLGVRSKELILGNVGQEPVEIFASEGANWRGIVVAVGLKNLKINNLVLNGLAENAGKLCSVGAFQIPSGSKVEINRLVVEADSTNLFNFDFRAEFYLTDKSEYIGSARVIGVRGDLSSSQRIALSNLIKDGEFKFQKCN